jgi:hypothetical protein
MNNIKQNIIFILSLLLFSVFALNKPYAQTSKELEHNKQKQLLRLQERKLDSLNIILQKKIISINKEKSKPETDKSKLQKLLSGTANLTNEIEKTQIIISGINTKIKVLEKELVHIYTKEINEIKKSSLSKKEKNKQIIKLTEKKLLVSPKIDILSFNPNKILLTNKPKDSIKQKIYYEHLVYAQNEIEKRIKETHKLKTEIENIILLSEKSEEFLEESNFDNDVISYTTTPQNKANNLSSDGSYFDASKERGNNILSQTNSFSEILNQIKLSSINKEQSFDINNLTLNEKTNIYNFKKIIEQVEQQLKEYLSVINNKLKETSK